MKYIDAIKGSSIALIIFSIATIYIPGRGDSKDIEIILTVSTFLFAILAGFFISRLNSRFESIRDHVAEEDANWVSLYQESKLLGKSFQKKIRELIDQYYVIAYDYDLGKYYKYNQNQIKQIYIEINKVKNKVKNLDIVENLLDILGEIEKNRNKSSVLTGETMTLGQWSVIFILAGIIIFSIFDLKTAALYSQIIAVMLSTTLILVILILRDLQNGRMGGKSLLSESGEEVFEIIEKLRYYNKIHIDQGVEKVPKHIKQYRLGLHKPGEKANIKIVQNN